MPNEFPEGVSELVGIRWRCEQCGLSAYTREGVPPPDRCGWCDEGTLRAVERLRWRVGRYVEVTRLADDDDMT